MTNINKAIKMGNNIKLNNEGGIGYELTLEEKIAEFFSLGLLNGTFYQSETQVLTYARELLEEALMKCPEFTTKAAIYGNSVNSLKLVPTIWLVYLSTLEDKTLFKSAFPKIIRNPKMLHDFMEISRKSGIREGLGRSIKSTINTWLDIKLNEYTSTRYKSKIKEVVKVTRPSNKNEDFQNYMKYITKNELTFDRAIALKEVLGNLLDDDVSERTIGLINEHSLQLDELKHSTINLSKENKRAIYKEMYKSLNYSALILNLVALERVFSINDGMEIDMPDDVLDIVVDKINDLESYRASNMLPFALFNAYKKVSIPELKSAITNVIKTMSKEAFKIDDNTNLVVAVDTSSSMAYNNISNSLNCLDVASLFGAMIKKSHTQTNLYAVATEIKEVNLKKQDDVFAMADMIKNVDVGYGTYFEQIMEKYNGEKYVILLTDSESADNLENVWKKTRKPKGAKLIVWQLSAENTKLSRDNSVVYLSGYSDRLLSLIRGIIENNVNQLDEIKAIQV